MANGGAFTAAQSAGGPKPAFLQQQSESVQSKRDLASWWKQFKRGDKKPQQDQAPQGIFGVPLQVSIRYANVAISLFNDEGQSYIYGYVPIVVAKCGVFLKEKATDVEGIFRLAGSEKRIKELKAAFDSPDRYGKGLDWTGYTVHDAANILRRYFNQLPEPIIPLDFYERFRDPLKNHQAQAVGLIEAQSPSVGDFDSDAAIRAYQALITELPPLNRQLLLYILDLLAVFASKSDLNKMTTPNLAAIFQPGLISHPQHDMAPQEYRLSQDVLIFLIENQDHFLIGMTGTEADPETVKHVQSGAPMPPQAPASPTTPSRSKTVIGRTSSNASAGADSVRRWGGIRRNASVSSKHSKNSVVGPTPATPTLGSPTTSSAVHRRNTVPSKRGNATSPRFSRGDKSSDPATPSPGESSPMVMDTSVPQNSSLQSTPIASTMPGAFPLVAPPDVTSASSSEATTPLATVGSETSSALTRDYQTPKKDTTPLLAPSSASTASTTERNPSTTPSTMSTRGFLDIFKQSPTSDTEGRKPNKLQKKRIPGSTLSSAQSSSHSLQNDGMNEQLSSSIQPSPISAAFPSNGQGHGADQSTYATAQSTPNQGTPQRMPTDATVRPTVSPSHSYESHADVTDASDVEMVGDELPASGAQPDRRHRRWKFSRAQNNHKDRSESASSNPHPLGAMTTREQQQSRSTVGSAGAIPRRSFQEANLNEPISISPPTTQPVQPVQPATTEAGVFSDSERERRGPMSWLRGKLQERKEKDAEKRAKTPPRNRRGSESKQSLALPTEPVPARGKSMEVSRLAEGAAPAPTQAPAQVPFTNLLPPQTPAQAPALGPFTTQPLSRTPAQALAQDTNLTEGNVEEQRPAT